jgi:hypothetical protein
LKKLVKWGLDWHETGGRLSALELLARLQHFGVPTRLLDFTFNPLIALWFAVEEDNPADGRVFAIDISERGLTRERAAQDEPWWLGIRPRVDTEWTTQSWAWRPPPIEARISRQEGCFLMGGVPSTQPQRNVRRPHGGWRFLRANEVRACMSIPFQLISYEQANAAYANVALVGQPPRRVRAFTLRISNRLDIRVGLAQGFGYSRRSLFPDLAGFALYATSFSVPPRRYRRLAR